MTPRPVEATKRGVERQGHSPRDGLADSSPLRQGEER
jgi:hypothetical protein